MKQPLKQPPAPPVITLRQLPTFTVCVDGIELNGTFKVVSEWEGFVKLSSDSPRRDLIIRKPTIKPANQFDLIPKLFGGNRNTNEPLEIECEQIGGDVEKPKAYHPPL